MATQFKNLHMGDRFCIGDDKYVVIPGMAIRGHDGSSYFFNAILEDPQPDEYAAPRHTVAYVLSETEVDEQ